MEKKKFSYRRMTNLGGVVCLIQGFCAFAFSCFFLELYLHKQLVIPVSGNDRAILHYLTGNEYTLIVIMLFTLGIVHLTWIISSIYLLLGNRNGNEKSIQQYLIVTTVVSITDIVLPFVMLSTTYEVFDVALRGRVHFIPGVSGEQTLPESSFGLYLFLLLGFMRGGGLTFAIDMFFIHVAYKQFIDLRKLRFALHGNSGLGIPKHLFDDSAVGYNIRAPEEEEELNFRQRTLQDEEEEQAHL